MALLEACIDTTRQDILYRDFIIAESIEGWEWTHKDYATNGITGTCQTVFEAIEAVEDWHRHDQSEAA